MCLCVFFPQLAYKAVYSISMSSKKAYQQHPSLSGLFLSVFTFEK